MYGICFSFTLGMYNQTIGMIEIFKHENVDARNTNFAHGTNLDLSDHGWVANLVNSRWDSMFARKVQVLDQKNSHSHTSGLSLQNKSFPKQKKSISIIMLKFH